VTRALGAQVNSRRCDPIRQLVSGIEIGLWEPIWRTCPA